MANNLWYWKQDGKVTGPFPVGQIQEYIILKRVHPSDLMSQDKENWQKASLIPSLIPDVIKNNNLKNSDERLAAAKRWADDREGERELSSPLSSDSAIKTIKRKDITHLMINVLGWKSVTLFFTFVVISLLLAFYLTPNKNIEIDCNMPGKIGVIYDRCQIMKTDFSHLNLDGASFKNANLQGASFYKTQLTDVNMRYVKLIKANLSYANLSGADLTGANLESTNLAYTNFSNADLSYANLNKAKAKQLNLKGTILNKTIWFNGQECAVGSIGKCLAKIKL